MSLGHNNGIIDVQQSQFDKSFMPCYDFEVFEKAFCSYLNETFFNESMKDEAEDLFDSLIESTVFEGNFGQSFSVMQIR